MNGNRLLGGLTHQQFLDEYWQQKPLLVRQAFPDIQPPCSAEELAGLCCDTEAPARLIMEKGDTPWQVIPSPLTEAHFLNLPETHWTLLINDFEQYYPQGLVLLDNFRFIPDWRIDDLMISYAPEDGSVGPHVDEYDVFLIQASGKRQWMLDNHVDHSKILPAIDLKILADFNAQQDWILEPGDMLYLPPHLAHYGVAKDDCMTYSVGFRSPSQQELIESWLDHLVTNNKALARYNDAGRAAKKHSGEIEQQDIHALKVHLMKAIREDETVESNNQFFTNWLGRYLTEQKNPDQENLLLDDHLASHISYFRQPGSRIAWIEHPEHIAVFINGECSNWPSDIKPGLEYLCATYQYPSDTCERHLQNENFKKLLQHLTDIDMLHST